MTKLRNWWSNFEDTLLVSVTIGLVLGIYLLVCISVRRSDPLCGAKLTLCVISQRSSTPVFLEISSHSGLVGSRHLH